MKPLFLVIGERVHEPLMEPTRVKRWRELWEQHPVRCMLTTPAMVEGPTRRKLEELIGRSPDKVINVMPPDNVCGSWQPKVAARYMAALKGHLATNRELFDGEQKRQITRIMLCGARVHDAWNEQIGDLVTKKPIGETWEWEGIRCLYIPHPSGRNRLWNDHKNVELVERACERFFQD